MRFIYDDRAMANTTGTGILAINADRSVANIAASLAVARFGTARITADEILDTVNSRK